MNAFKFSTTLPAASLEFCPREGLWDVFVCGTYKLEESSNHSITAEDTQGTTDVANVNKQTRVGNCLLYQADLDGHFRQTQDVEVSGILDMKWCHCSSDVDPKEIVSMKDGSPCFIPRYESPMPSHSPWTGQTVVHPPGAPDSRRDIYLLIDDESTIGSLIVSLSDGSICLMRPSSSGYLDVVETWKAHDFEPWVAAWNYWDPNLVYSGGDDMHFKGWDLRNALRTPIFADKTSFSAGVTSIQSNPHIEHLIAVGSYDDTVRLFDARNVNKPLSLTQLNVGGGAWRVKWHPRVSRQYDLLVACMYNGAKVIHYNSDGHSRVLKSFDKHESIVYGADWSFAHPQEGDVLGETVVATCSFYDSSLHVWSA